MSKASKSVLPTPFCLLRNPSPLGGNILSQNVKIAPGLSSQPISALPRKLPPTPFNIIQEVIFKSFPWTLLIKQLVKHFYLLRSVVLELWAHCFIDGSWPLCSLTKLSSHFLLSVMQPASLSRIHSWFCLASTSSLSVPPVAFKERFQRMVAPFFHFGNDID